VYSRVWVDPVPDPLLLRKPGSAWESNTDLLIFSQELWPLDHRGGLTHRLIKKAPSCNRYPKLVNTLQEHKLCCSKLGLIYIKLRHGSWASSCVKTRHKRVLFEAEGSICRAHTILVLATKRGNKDKWLPCLEPASVLVSSECSFTVQRSLTFHFRLHSETWPLSQFLTFAMSDVLTSV
jgi:hypothetical protein